MQSHHPHPHSEQNTDSESNLLCAPILRPPWLHIVRLLWLGLAAAGFILAAIGITKTAREPLPACTTAGAACAPYMVSREDVVVAQQAGLPEQSIQWLVVIGLVFPKITFGLVALLIFWRRSDDWVALLFALMLALFAVEGVTNLGLLQPAADLLYFLASLAFGLLPFIFPDGRFVPHRNAWVAIPMSVVSSGLYFLPRFGVQVSEAVYSALLIGLLALVYFGGVVVLQGVVGTLTGNTETPLITVLTTLIIAALFNPLRNRVQSWVDQRFYRRKYDAEQTLARFAQAARDEVDLDRLTHSLVGMVTDTMQPARASLWLRSGKESA